VKNANNAKPENLNKPMTEQQFKNFIRQPDKIQDAINYIVCILAILAGLFFLSLALQISTNRPKHALDIYAAIFLLSMGVYGLWRIPKDYEIVSINSDKTLEQKRQITENYLLTLNVRNRFVSGVLYRIRYRNKFLNSVDLCVAFDEKRFFISAKGADNYGGKGMIDFGLTRRATKRAKQHFNGKASI
jgi:hypothetical protein